jgi:hypothetical protein
MRHEKPFQLLVAGTIATALVVSVLGCGDDSGIGKRYPVSGTVKYKGEPVTKGRITFAPAKSEGRAAAGDIHNGSYALTTVTNADGALPGSYRVSFVSKEVDLTQVTANQKGGSPRPNDVIKANKTAKNLIPVKYGTPETSGKTAEVKEESNTINFDLSE